MPVSRRPSPAHGQHSVNNSRKTLPRSIAQGRQIWDQSDKPEEQRDRGIGRNGKHAQDEGTPKLRQGPHCVGVREEPIGQPRPAYMKRGIDGRASHSEQSHGLGETVYGSSPLLSQEEQDRRNECAGMPNTNPPDESDNFKRPADGDIVSPDANTRKYQHGQSKEEEDQ